MRKLLSVTLLSLVFGFAQAAEPDTSFNVTMSWHMSLDSKGQVTGLSIKPGRLNDALRVPMERAIRNWEFEPGKLNGQPTPTETTLRVKFNLTPTADKQSYAVTVDGVATGTSLKKIGKAARLSREEATRRRDLNEEALLVLDIVVDSDGVPETIAVADGSPITEGSLVDQAIKAVKTWKYEPERVAGHGVRSRVLQPICYEFSSDNSNGEKCKWKSPYSRGAQDSGSSIALDSTVKLKSDVIGRTL